VRELHVRSGRHETHCNPPRRRSFLNACSTLGQLAWQAADQAGRYSAKRVVVDDITVPDG